MVFRACLSILLGLAASVMTGCEPRTDAYRGEEHLIGHAAGADGGEMADLDGDGLIDVLIAAEEGCSVIWYRQTEAGAWQPHTLVSGTIGPEDVAVADFDGDGDRDIVLVNDESENCTSGSKVMIARNGGGPADLPWDTHLLVAGLGAINVATADFNGDGNPDIVYADKIEGRYVWLENPGAAQAFEDPWPAHVMAEGDAVAGAYAVVLVDWDGDGDLDLLGSARQAGAILWLEQPADPRAPWPRHLIGQTNDPNHVAHADIDGDGDLDVLMAAFRGSEVAWFENLDGARFKKHRVDKLYSSVGIAAYDMDGDGQLEIIASQYFDRVGASVQIYEPKRGLYKEWVGSTLVESIVSGDELWLHDLDGDSIPEIITTSNDRSFTPEGGRAFWIKVVKSAR